ncbi:MAG: hypothetical protein VKL39_23900 [Leptolyngbyaceae bacterium]|nr:hypothetical protein [Leptolyngbyaceae bacterium]
MALMLYGDRPFNYCDWANFSNDNEEKKGLHLSEAQKRMCGERRAPHIRT